MIDTNDALKLFHACKRKLSGTNIMGEKLNPRLIARLDAAIKAASQPEGDEVKAMLADLRARDLHDAAEMLAVTDYGYRKVCEANDMLGKLVPQHTLRIAAREAVLREARTQLFSLCEDTETHCASIAEQDTENKIGAFARGRIREAKSIRNAMGEVFRKLLTPTSGAASGKGEEG